jgi:hypothetical protein
LSDSQGGNSPHFFRCAELLGQIMTVQVRLLGLLAALGIVAAGVSGCATVAPTQGFADGNTSNCSAPKGYLNPIFGEDLDNDPLCLKAIPAAETKSVSEPGDANSSTHTDTNAQSDSDAPDPRLTEIYDRSLTYCLYYKNRQNRVSLGLTDGLNFGDAAVALAAPIAAFIGGANAAVTGLVGGIAGVFGGQLKTAINGAVPTSASDYSQTSSEMDALYQRYAKDPRLVAASGQPPDPQADTAITEFKDAMTQTCFSSLTFEKKQQTADDSANKNKNKAKNKDANLGDENKDGQSEQHTGSQHHQTNS